MLQHLQRHIDGLRAKSDTHKRLQTRVTELSAQVERLLLDNASWESTCTRLEQEMSDRPDWFWINEDELPSNLSREVYDFLFPISKIIDGVRMFPWPKEP